MSSFLLTNESSNDNEDYLPSNGCSKFSISLKGAVGTKVEIRVNNFSESPDTWYKVGEAEIASGESFVHGQFTATGRFIGYLFTTAVADGNGRIPYVSIYGTS